MRRSRRILLGMVSVLALLYAAYYLWFEHLGNFHTVTPGVLYRSGQLDPERFRELARRHEIRSVLNLRGASPGADWWERQTAVARELGIRHYDVGIRARFEPAPEKIDEILKVFESAPRPLLIHCRAGADRTSLAVAMWKMAVEGEGKAEAQRQMSILYGHIPFGQAAPMTHFFERWSAARSPEIPPPPQP